MIDTHSVVRTLTDRFLVNHLFIMDPTHPRICAHVNGLAGWGLALIGYQELAKEVAAALLSSPLYNQQYRLFHREMDIAGRITIDDLNTTKNVAVGLLLQATGYVTEAEAIVSAIYGSPVWDQRTGLFRRQFNPRTGRTTRSVSVQTNAWMALLLHKLHHYDQAREIMEALVREFADTSTGLYPSQHCEQPVTVRHRGRAPNSRTTCYTDDQALLIITFYLLGRRRQAKALTKALLASPLYDRSCGLFYHSIAGGEVNPVYSTYKNGLAGLALAAMQHWQELGALQEVLDELLFDAAWQLFPSSPDSNVIIPDNVVLALLASNAHEVMGKIV